LGVQEIVDIIGLSGLQAQSAGVARQLQAMARTRNGEHSVQQ